MRALASRVGPLRVLAGFVVLGLYLRAVPSSLGAEGALWVVLFAGFFLLAHGVARATGLRGLADCGYRARPGAARAAVTGLAIGAGLWLALAGVEFATGTRHAYGPRMAGDMAWIAVQAIVVAILGSTTNDLWIRGYVLAHLQGRVPAAFAIAISAVIYTVDDFLIGGFTVRNALFSLLLGVAFALAAVRRGDLWLSSGLHVGINLVHWLLNGVGDSGGLLILGAGRAPAWLAWAGVAGAGLMAGWVAWATRREREALPAPVARV